MTRACFSAEEVVSNVSEEPKPGVGPFAVVRIIFLCSERSSFHNVHCNTNDCRSAGVTPSYTY